MSIDHLILRRVMIDLISKSLSRARLSITIDIRIKFDQCNRMLESTEETHRIKTNSTVYN